jgi:hypothetical protein
MVESASEITRSTFLRQVCPEDLRELELRLGYERHAALGLTMASDWHVVYYRSTYDGRPCYYFAHSHIEYIFL